MTAPPPPFAAALHPALHLRNGGGGVGVGVGGAQLPPATAQTHDETLPHDVLSERRREKWARDTHRSKQSNAGCSSRENETAAVKHRCH